MKFLTTLIATSIFATSAMASNFLLTSPSLKNGGTLPEESVYNGFGCNGLNVSPELNWSNAPAGTKSFAVTVYDPDAPTGSGWWHWTVFNIPASAKKLEKNSGNMSGSLPKNSIQGRTDFGKPGYGGACPPKGHKVHRYFFTVYALKVEKLPLDPDASGALVGFYINQNKIDQAKIMVKYGR